MPTNWGVGQRLSRNNILASPGVDANGALNYRLQVVNGALIEQELRIDGGSRDVYQFMLSFRYSFN